MRYFQTAICGTLLSGSLAAVAVAQEPTDVPAVAAARSAVVVELFTSQGCVSCPPADAYFAQLATDPNILALSLHVDYWDYIGWKDSFGDPAFTTRQKHYARAIGSRTIYTPQFVIAGQERVEGFDADEIASAVLHHAAAAAAVDLRLDRHGDSVSINAKAPAPFPAPVQIELVRYLPQETVMIETGENAGQTITYRNIVTSWVTLGEWGGAEPLAISAAITGPEAGVVILQQPGPGAILAAERIR